MSKVSIITRTKNRPFLLERAAADIMSQDYRDYSWVVVNDGGDPDVLGAVLERVAGKLGPRLQVIHHAQSQDRPAAANAGITASDSRYVVLHDDDDTWDPTFLSKTVDVLSNRPHASVQGVVTHCTKIWENIDGTSITETARESYNGNLWSIGLTDILTQHCVVPICFLYERAVHDAIGLYDFDAVAEDWEFYLRYYQTYESVVLRQHLANYHIRPTGSSADGNSTITIMDKFNFFIRMTKNRLLREDVAAGRFGVGVLAANLDAMGGANKSLHLSLSLMLPLQEARRDGVSEVVVCGAGDVGRKVAQVVKGMNLSIRCMTDRNITLHGTRCEGVPIVSLEEGVRTGLPCVIGSQFFATEIADEISRLALENGIAVPPIYRPVRLG